MNNVAQHEGRWLAVVEGRSWRQELSFQSLGKLIRGWSVLRKALAPEHRRGCRMTIYWHGHRCPLKLGGKWL